MLRAPPRLAAARRYEACLVRDDDRLGAVAEVQLGQDAADVGLRGLILQA